MSRSNGPGGPPPNRWPERPQAPAPQYPDQGYQQGYQGSFPADPPAPFGAPAQPPQQHGYAPQQPQHNQPQHHPAYPPQQPVQPAYHYPDQGYAADSYSQPTLGAPGPHGGAPSYAPQFEPYVPPTAPPRQQPQHADPFAHAQPAPAWPPAPQVEGHGGYSPFEPVTQPTAPPHRQRDPRIVSEPAFTAPPQQQPEWPPAPDLRGPTYDQQPQWPPAGGAHDPYAGYQPAQAQPQQGYAAETQWHHEAPQGDHGYAPHTQPPAGYGYGDGYAAQPGYPQQAAYAQPGYEEPQTAAANSFGVPAPAEQADDYDAEYDDEERSGRGRMMVIAAALVGAIGIGGGLAYGYKTFFGAGSSDGTPIVRSESQPAKVKPLDPGGKKFAHTDSKVLGRLNDGSSSGTSSSAQAEDDGAPRKVTTMVVGRDGSIVPVASPPPGEPSSAPSAPVASAPAAPAPASGVPGLTIVDGFGGRPPAATAPSAAPRIAIPSAPVAPRAAPPSAPVAAPAVVNVKPMVPAAAAKPTVIARAEPESKLSDAEPDEVKPAAKKAVKKPVNDAYGSATTAAATAAAPAAASASGAGFVAVLASIPSSNNSRMEALKQFADLQQRYPSQLQSKSPEVQSANLAGKGNYDRLIVGPPGSRQQANALCEQLKSAGYSGCWIKSY